ncbi:GNAT family N-acetyltransferase [Pedobacter montanisoli]|uniref:GNAT family N-acetyltransferase n=1 Tax=Pedobacter montanisoli TaxID=2923277 RepID=A0ABS9ZWC4_9SPHI|nr:GNAT family N-acetyltransferase [Pedobacter montanisoli]MCJ0742614.1 GNAT family N-acetyltransferase [Pedobacter montanisoli]
MNVVIEQTFPSLTWAIRQEAMYPGKDLEAVKLDDDFNGIHFGLYVNHALTGVVSLFIDQDRAQFRKLAVLPHMQRKGLGNLIIQNLISFCKTEKLSKIWCNARVDAIGFYEKNGFVTSGEPFSRNHLQYIKMELLLG